LRVFRGGRFTPLMPLARISHAGGQLDVGFGAI
jgi:hypothetical protein